MAREPASGSQWHGQHPDHLRRLGANTAPPCKSFRSLLDQHAYAIGHLAGARALRQLQKGRQTFAVGQIVGQAVGFKDSGRYSWQFPPRTGRGGIQHPVEALVREFKIAHGLNVSEGAAKAREVLRL